MALTDSLVAYWSLGEASGTRADSHGSNHLTDNNTVGSAAGVVGNAADFEAANSEYLSIADNAALSLAGTGWTIHTRVRLESKPSFASIVSKYETVGNQREYWLDYRSGVDRFAGTVSPDGADTTVVTHYANSLGSPSIGVWYDLFWWLDLAAGTLNLQVNDGPVDSVSYTGGVFDGTSPLHVGALGRAAATFFFDGLIDVVALWKRALTAAERTDLYNGGAGRDYAYLAGGTTLTGTPEIGPLGVTPVTLTARKRSGLAPVAVSLTPVAPTVRKRAVASPASLGITPLALTVPSAAASIDPASIGLSPVTLGTRKRASLPPSALELSPVAPSVRRRVGLAPVAIALRANVPAGRKRATLAPAGIELLVIGPVEELPVPHASAVWRAGARSTVWRSSQRSTVWRA